MGGGELVDHLDLMVGKFTPSIILFSVLSSGTW